MATLTGYSMEIKRTKNKATNKTLYYLNCCDRFTRISLARYDEIRDQCDGVSNLFTKSNKKQIEHFTTCVYYNK